MGFKAKETSLFIIWSLLQMINILVSGNPNTSFINLETLSGRIKGTTSHFTTHSGPSTVSQFLGIPYAKPPVDERRFARPEPIDPWQTTYDATKLPNCCPQVVDTTFGDFEGSQMWNANTNISEDCLYLNVWTPDVKQDTPLAVMVWIYGGSFSSGSSTLDIYNGRILATTGNVVVVSMQFRIGAIGFLYLNHPEAPGNMGLLDQALAIEWISNNIHIFGGDKNRITLFGESSGAASSSLQLLSPLSKQFVNNVILQSASSLSVWAVDMPEDALTKSKTLANLLGCYGDTIEMLTCLKTKDPITISEMAFKVHDQSPIFTPITPTVDKYFLHDTPINLINSGEAKQVSTLLGMNKNEGSFFLIYEYDIPKNSNVKLSSETYMEKVKKVLPIQDEDLLHLVSYEYESYAFDPYPDYVNNLDHLLGDVAFVCPVVDIAERYAEAGNDVFMYYFTHRTSGNPWPDWTGVMHGYEIDHMFGAPLNDSLHGYTDGERQLSTKMISYWSNFAKSGDPNRGDAGDSADAPGVTLPRWPVYTTQEKSALQLKTGKIETVYGPREKKCRFWHEIYPALSDTLSIYQMGNGANGIPGISASHPWFYSLLLFGLLISL